MWWYKGGPSPPPAFKMKARQFVESPDWREEEEGKKKRERAQAGGEFEMGRRVRKGANDYINKAQRMIDRPWGP